MVDAATAFTPVCPIQKHLRSQSSHQMNDLTMKRFPLGSQAFALPVSFCNYGAILGKNDEVYRVSVSLRCSNMRKGDGDLRQGDGDLSEKQKNDLLQLNREIDQMFTKLNRQVWPIFRAHCISLAVQVLQVFYCEKPKDQPKNVRSVFNDRWLKDEQCIDMIRKNFQVDDSDKRQELCDGFEKMRVGQKSAAVFETQVQDAIVSLDERGTLPTDDAELQLAYKVLQKYRSILVREHNDRKEGWAGGNQLKGGGG